MRNAPLLKAFVGLLALTVVGCSGSSSDAAEATIRFRCPDGVAFCLQSCDLGCSLTGCAVNEVAENQRLKFTFSQRVDPASVNSASVSIRTATGVAPEGELLVQGNVLTFAPRVRTVNGTAVFGFARNETYRITIAGGAGAGQVVRSEAGDVLAREFFCTVTATQGIIDNDQLPPSATLVAPANTEAAPVDATIVLRFSELIDTAPIEAGLSATTPINIGLRGSFVSGGVRQCNRDGEAVILRGVPRISVEREGDHDVTVVSFRPNVVLPGGACVEVNITGDLRDLAGRAAVPATLAYFTETTTSVPIELIETFATQANMDTLVSSGTWNNGATAGLLGGDGRHGSFDPTLNGGNWNTDSFAIPASHSLNGTSYTVTDGKFYFTDFTLPAGSTLRFTGLNPVQIYVTGKVEINGVIELNAASMTALTDPRGGTGLASVFAVGQNPLAAGPGGGRGGKGADECTGTGPVFQNGRFIFDGENGADLGLQAGHAYAANRPNTGGRGSPMKPSSGLNADARTPVINPGFGSHFSPGGGGGGFFATGGVATVSPAVTGTQIGPTGPAAVAFSLQPYPPVSPPPGYSSLRHFLVGGSGGGGGGSHSFGIQFGTSQQDVFMAGGAGTGGGGAIAIRAGSSLTVAAAGRIEAKGGAGVVFDGAGPAPQSLAQARVYSPGGGGSGGSVLLQSGASLQAAGALDTSGGAGSVIGGAASISFIGSVGRGGSGSAGAVRLEAGNTVLFTGTSVPAFSQPTMSGVLTDRDSQAMARSLWRSTNQVFPPAWEHYEMDVDMDGNGTIDVTYTDTGAAGTSPANDPAGPVRVQFQGAKIDQTTGQPEAGTIRSWRDFVGDALGDGLNIDSATGVRFMLTFNRDAFPNCVVRRLHIMARG